MDLGLAGKRVLLTGGSRGIGRAIALGLARAGARVTACYNRESQDVERLRRELTEIGGGSRLVQADVSDPASVERFVSDARQALGGLDALINNAGIVSHKPIDQLELEEWRRVIDTNLTAVFLVTKS